MEILAPTDSRYHIIKDTTPVVSLECLPLQPSSQEVPDGKPEEPLPMMPMSLQEAMKKKKICDNGTMFNQIPNLFTGTNEVISPKSQSQELKRSQRIANRCSAKSSQTSVHSFDTEIDAELKNKQNIGDASEDKKKKKKDRSPGT